MFPWKLWLRPVTFSAVSLVFFWFPSLGLSVLEKTRYILGLHFNFAVCETLFTSGAPFSCLSMPTGLPEWWMNDRGLWRVPENV